VDKKKVAAVMGGVMRYIQEEEAKGAAAAPPAPRAAQSPWAASGRQETMQMSLLLQLRVLR